MGGRKLRITIEKQILTAAIAIIIVFTGLLGYTFYELKTMQAGYNGLINRSAPLVMEVKDLNAELRNQSSQVRAFILTADEKYAKQYQDSRSKMSKIIVSLESKLLTPEGKQKIDELKKDLAGYHSVADGAVQARRTKGQEEAIKLVAAGGEKANAAEEEMASFVTFLTERMDLRIEENETNVKKLERILLGLSIAAVVIALYASRRFARRISRPLAEVSSIAGQIAAGTLANVKIAYPGNDEIADLIMAFEKMSDNLRGVITKVAKAAEQVAASSEELSASADESAKASTQVAQTVVSVAAGAEDQTRVVDQTSAVVQDMTAAISQIAKTSNHVSAKSSETAKAAHIGNEAVEQATRQMTDINRSVTHAAQVVQKLGEGSKRIGEIVSVITQIAGQTNLLALNAAIEAARAGEQGRGFAVVAEEVRRLAEQSQAAAGEISDIIHSIQNDTDTAVQAMQQGTADVTLGTEVIAATGERFHDITALVEELNTQIQEISAATEELAASSDEVAHSVSNVKQIAAGTAANTQTISAAAEEQTATMQEIAASSISLSHMAEDLRDVVATFKL